MTQILELRIAARSHLHAFIYDMDHHPLFIAAAMLPP